MSLCKIHNIKFYNLKSKSITCMCYESKFKKLGVARHDNSIEIWNLANVPFVEYVIYRHANVSVESILWIGQRLFSTGVHGMVTEYNLATLTVEYETPVTGGPAWCMDVNHENTCIAVGTEYGYINTFLVKADTLIFGRIFDKQNERILCIKWDNSGSMIYTGSTGNISVWCTISGRTIHKMTTSRTEVKKETIIWCLAVTDDNVIISGDSAGCLSFWDPQLGVLIKSHKSHAADILAVALSHDMNTVYCAGVDPVVRSFSKVTLKSGNRAQWVKGVERRLHAHDVRTLVDAGGKLYSAGANGYLVQSSYPPKLLVKYPPLLQPPCVSICKMSRCILLRYTNFLELWRLGSTTKVSSDFIRNGMVHQLEEEPIKLLHLKAKADESIIACAINKDSKTIVYSTNSHVRVFRFDIVDGDVQLSRNDTDILLPRVQKMQFSSNGKLFVAINNDSNNSNVTLYKVDQKLTFAGSFQTKNQSVKNISLICFSPDARYLACADHNSIIVIYKIDENVSHILAKSWQLPEYNCPPTAIAIQKGTLNLVVVYSDHKIVEYSILRARYTEFSNNLQSHLPKQWLTRSFPITNILFHPHNENIIIMHDNSMVYVINKMNEHFTMDVKFRKDEKDDSSGGNNSILSSQSPYTFQIVKKYKHLVYLNWLNNEEMVAVQVNPTSLKKKLPPSLKQKLFGM